ncbi:MAG TPA: crossover junction endodeoxyribonuclease RuvC [Verrucomicrobiae bacterium]
MGLHWHSLGVGISLKQFEQLKSRMAGGSAAAEALIDARHAKMAAQTILGIDPSLRGTGYGIIRSERGTLQVLAQGTIACPATWEQSRCLANIAQTLRGVLQQQPVDVCIVEGIFFAQNLKTAIIMGAARGAALATVAEAGVEIYEIATRKVKQAIVGYGAAQKLAVAKMVQRMLGMAELPAPDAADALALALTHAQEHGRFSLKAPKRI